MANRVVLLAVAALLAGLTGPVSAQPEVNRFNERQVEKKPNPQDREGIWMLDFHFKDPRVVTVDIPGRGRKLVWYLWYQVSNQTPEPRQFIPRFVWVDHNTDTARIDQILPKAQLTVQRLEDPTNILDIKNSHTISETPIPVSKEFDDKQQRISFPKVVTGVATWDDIDPKCSQFSIFVYGLSDGWAVVDGPDGKPIVRRKTLQLKFKRLGDEHNQHAGQIRYQGFDWIYAPIDQPIPTIPEAAPKKPEAPEKQPAEEKKANPPTGRPAAER